MRTLPLLLALLLAPAVARADDNQTIAVLIDAHGKLEIYAQPVATEVARALEKDGYTIIVVTSTSSVPSRARLVIDGRIVRGKDDAVKIEAIVRDPTKGRTIDELTASAPALTRIDEAAAELATRLAPILEAGLAEQARETTPRITEPTTNGDGAAPRKKAARDRRPLALISMATRAAPRKDDPSPEPLLAAGAARLARLLGHRSEELRGVTAADDVAGQLGQRGAALAVHVELLTISYADRGVITARARARVRVTGADGRAVFDRVVRTDTLVGGRGDRRDAVARAAVDQIVDIAAPRIREKLEARR
jgi:hypothetical protein